MSVGARYTLYNLCATRSGRLNSINIQFNCVLKNKTFYYSNMYGQVILYIY